jgi:GNAT superfamily N-acetyltransferase
VTVVIRIARPTEVGILNDIRTSVRENHMTIAQMEAYGITAASIAELIVGTGRAWIGEIDGVDAGFSIADSAEGNIFAMFVRPEFEGHGLGGLLLSQAETFLFERGLNEIWLEAGATEGLRAHGFYSHAGWQRSGTMPDGQLRFVKQRP